MSPEYDPTQRIPQYDHERPEKGSYYIEDENDGFFDDENLPFYVVIGLLAILLVFTLLTMNDSNSGPATANVEACAAIENPEAAKACFSAIDRKNHED